MLTRPSLLLKLEYATLSLATILLYHHLDNTWLLFALLFLIAYPTNHPTLIAVALIWTSHITFDRLLGYGLKYPTFFKDTHLQHIP